MKRIFFILASSLPAFLCGQSYHFRQVEKIKEAGFQQINVIFQSKDQFVWLGTDRGLFVYDGRQCRSVSVPGAEDVPVTTIAENTNGQIWTGHKDGSIRVYSSRHLKNEYVFDSLLGVEISTLVFHQQHVYIATDGKGIWEMTADGVSRIDKDPFVNMEDINDALIDHKGQLWMATDNGIWIFDPNNSSAFRHLDQENGLPDEIVTKLVLGKNGDIWIGLYDHGLARYVQAKDTIVSLWSSMFTDGPVVDLVKGEGSQVWLASEKALYTYSPNGLTYPIDMPAEANGRIKSLLLDQEGNLWLVVGNKIFIAHTWLQFLQPGISGIQAIESALDQLWLGSKEGLFSLDKNDFTLKQHLGKNDINVLTIYADPAGLLWIGTFGQGLFLYDPVLNRVKRISEEDGISNNSILNIDGQGRKIWLATLGGITEIQWIKDPLIEPLMITEFQDKYKFPPGYVYDVHAAENGTVWFGTDGKGVFGLRGKSFFSLTVQPDSTEKSSEEIKTVYSLITDHKLNLWICSSQGLVFQVDSTGHILQKLEGPLGSDQSLIESSTGEIMIIQEDEIVWREVGGQVYRFGQATGLGHFLPNLHAATTDVDGTLWIAGSDKLIHFIPSSGLANRSVVIHPELILPQSFLTKDVVRLPHDSNFLDIRYIGLWYQNPSEVQYRYKLEGHDLDWIYTQDRRAVYSKLSPGTYTFRIAASHNEDFSQVEEWSKKFVVLPPFYLRWWFIAGLAALILYLAYLYIRARLRRLQTLHQLEKEKTAFQLNAIQSQVNPHFLFNTFNTLSNIIEEDQQAAVDYVDQLSDFFRGVLMHRQQELIKMKVELDIARNYIYILQKRYGNNLRIVEDIHNLSGWIAPLSIQLLIENAIKHNIVSKEKPLTIHLSIDENWVKVANQVQPKFNSPVDSTGFGLSSLTARYQYLTREKVIVINEQNNFIVQIPVIHSNPAA